MTATMKFRYVSVVLLCALLLLLPKCIYGRVINDTAVVTTLSSPTQVNDLTLPNNSTVETVEQVHYLRRTNPRRRRKQQVVGDGMRDFKALSCNSQILQTSYVCTRTWSSMFGTSNVQTNRIVIPCGTCIVMNHASGILDLKNGIDIQGKLIIPDGVQLRMTFPSMIVQGELSLTSTKPVNGIPNIVFTVVGTNNELTFTPIDVNANACKGQSTCTAGKKSIVVAGGKITCTYIAHISFLKLTSKRYTLHPHRIALFSFSSGRTLSEWITQFYTHMDTFV
jgi:hypothetical protein